MIYTVECQFTDPASEAGWNDFYSLEKLPALISVAGFHTSQRFKALRPGCPTYLALHSIDGLDVLLGSEYRLKGGGNFSRWQEHIADWHRNLYAGLDRAPAVSQGEYLVLSSVGPEPLVRRGLAPAAIHSVALDRSPERRWLATAHASALAASDWPDGVHAYAPMSAPLTPGRADARPQ